MGGKGNTLKTRINGTFSITKSSLISLRNIHSTCEHILRVFSLDCQKCYKVIFLKKMVCSNSLPFSIKICYRNPSVYLKLRLIPILCHILLGNLALFMNLLCVALIKCYQKEINFKTKRKNLKT
jgi:hypothetical protein